MFMDVSTTTARPDILSVNGHVYPEVDTAHLGSTYREPAASCTGMPEMESSKTLASSAGRVCTQPRSSRGLAIGDLWNDGRVSAVVNKHE